MPNTQYPIQEELILEGQEKGYFFISADKSKIFYKTNSQAYDFDNEKEKQRACFVVNLIEEYGYSEQEIKLDFEMIIKDKPRVFDLAIIIAGRPVYGINIRKSDITRQDIFDLSREAKPTPCLPQKCQLIK